MPVHLCQNNDLHIRGVGYTIFNDIAFETHVQLVYFPINTLDSMSTF